MRDIADSPVIGTLDAQVELRALRIEDLFLLKLAAMRKGGDEQGVPAPAAAFAPSTEWLDTYLAQATDELIESAERYASYQAIKVGVVRHVDASYSEDPRRHADGRDQLGSRARVAQEARVRRDPDASATNGNAAREVWLKYDATYPALVTEVRRKSDLHPQASQCSPSVGDP